MIKKYLEARKIKLMELLNKREEKKNNE